MSVDKKDHRNRHFPPAFHLQCTLSAPNQPLTPAQFLTLQLSRYVPEGAIVADNSPEAKALSLLNSGDEIDWDTAACLQSSIRVRFISGIPAWSIMAKNKANGSKAAIGRRARARAWREVVDAIVQDLFVRDRRDFRRLKQEMLIAVRKDPRAEAITVADGTLGNYLREILPKD